VSARRAVDVTVSALLLGVTAPLLVVMGVAVVVESGRPVLYTAIRAGRDGRPFRLRKMRTMRTDLSGVGVTRAGDPRVTRVGKVLRATKLDELPQLWNVLRGDMALVGPRPEDPRYVAHYTASQRALLAYRPGLTSPATVAFRDEEELLHRLGGDVEHAYRATVLPAKLAIDAAYFPHATLRSDLAVLARTVVAVVRPPTVEAQLALVRHAVGA
jgi:lipopolysaccharide/colanic/teichoic acid biosynthesis glycosyltransferase